MQGQAKTMDEKEVQPARTMLSEEVVSIEKACKGLNVSRFALYRHPGPAVIFRYLRN